MTQSRVPNPQFFSNHKKSMIKIIERNKPIFEDCEKDLNEILMYLDKKQRYAEYMIQHLNPHSESESERDQYSMYKKIYEQLIPVQKKAFEIVRRKNNMIKKNDELKSYILKSNKQLDVIVKTYQDIK